MNAKSWLWNKEGKGTLRAGYENKKKFDSTPSFNKLGNTRLWPEWT